MHRVLITTVLIAGCSPETLSDVCADIDCSVNGRCVDVGSQPACLCDAGFTPGGAALTCVLVTNQDGGSQGDSSSGDTDIVEVDGATGDADVGDTNNADTNTADANTAMGDTTGGDTTGADSGPGGDNVPQGDTNTPGPVRSNPFPGWPVLDGTTEFPIGLTTDVTAECRYATSPGVDFASMTDVFDNTNDVSHSSTVTGLTDGATFTYYIRCEAAGAANVDDFVIDVIVDPTPATIEHFRSVGPTNNVTMANGLLGRLTIVGTLATFEGPLFSNVGVGDVIAYDSTDDGLVDEVAVIARRYSNSAYGVRAPHDAAPPPVTLDIDWSLARAYLLLSDAVFFNENTAIPASVRDFDELTTSRNLANLGESLSFAGYADGVDTGTANIGQFWVTNATNRLRIFAPFAPNEVGVSQRHTGVWTPSAYQMSFTGGGGNSIQVSSADALAVDIEGIQFDVDPPFNALDSYGVSAVVPDGITRISHCLFKGTDSPANNVHAAIRAGQVFSGTGEQHIFNNIFYGFDDQSALEVAVHTLAGANTLVHHNTFVDCTVGINSTGGLVSARNNLFFNVTTPAMGTFQFSSDYNATNGTLIGYDGPVGANDLLGQTFTFVDAPSGDYHLSVLDTGAQDLAGLILSVTITDDIDLEPRTGVHDIGADEVVP